jgi:hypothetical protein
MASDTPSFLLYPRLPDELKVQIIACAWEAELMNRDTKPKITFKFIPVATGFDVELIRWTFPRIRNGQVHLTIQIYRAAFQE